MAKGTGKYRVLCEICGKTFEIRDPLTPLPDHSRPRRANSSA